MGLQGINILDLMIRTALWIVKLVRLVQMLFFRKASTVTMKLSGADFTLKSQC